MECAFGVVTFAWVTFLKLNTPIGSSGVCRLLVESCCAVQLLWKNNGERGGLINFRSRVSHGILLGFPVVYPRWVPGWPRGQIHLGPTDESQVGPTLDPIWDPVGTQLVVLGG